MATATAPAVTREMLEDRYEGLTNKMDDHGTDIDYTELQSQLSSALGDLVAGTARCHHDDTGHIVEDLFVTIRNTIVDRVLADGLADPKPWSEYKAYAS